MSEFVFILVLAGWAPTEDDFNRWGLIAHPQSISSNYSPLFHTQQDCEEAKKSAEVMVNDMFEGGHEIHVACLPLEIGPKPASI